VSAGTGAIAQSVRAQLSMASFQSPLVATKSPHPSELRSISSRPGLTPFRARFSHAE
jgi:hypothetical protein